ncbi:hypothetical protein BGX33_003162 [Mortierella sp. NVP41]|nr:hypothetical protein BGX33_003162 [Mortierella sp. NVP41]
MSSAMPFYPVLSQHHTLKIMVEVISRQYPHQLITLSVSHHDIVSGVKDLIIQVLSDDDVQPPDFILILWNSDRTFYSSPVTIPPGGDKTQKNHSTEAMKPCDDRHP